jgi:hypothetical protein
MPAKRLPRRLLRRVAADFQDDSILKIEAL